MVSRNLQNPSHLSECFVPLSKSPIYPGHFSYLYIFINCYYFFKSKLKVTPEINILFNIFRYVLNNLKSFQGSILIDPIMQKALLYLFGPYLGDTVVKSNIFDAGLIFTAVYEWLNSGEVTLESVRL